MRIKWWSSIGVLVVGGLLVGWWWKEIRSKQMEMVPVNREEVSMEEYKGTDKDQTLGVRTEKEEVRVEFIEEASGDEERRGWTEAGGRLGVVVEDYANRYGGLSGLESKLRKNISTVSIYKQFGLEFNDRLVADDLEYVKSSGKKLLIAWEPWDPRQGMGQSRDYLAEILAGSLDGYINEFAEEVASFGNPVVIRFGHEMNGNWYPWGGRPGEYVKAYQHVVEVFRARGVSNASFMWSINAESVPVEPISEVRKYYPGDTYVDVIGIDGFNFGTTGSGNRWRSFEEIFLPAYEELTSFYNKPIIVSEVASAEEGGSKANWVDKMFDTLGNQMVGIGEVVWFNLLKEADWRMESTDSSLNSFIYNL